MAETAAELQNIRNFGNALSLIMNEFFSREDWARDIAGRGDTRRDIDKECGYPEVVQLANYKTFWDRKGIASRVVSVYPDECWKSDPEVYETKDEEVKTPFDIALQDLLNTADLNIWSYLHRADVWSGIGCYGIILLGINDGKLLSEPVTPSANNKLMYMRVYDQMNAHVKLMEADPTSPRYGLPVLYAVNVVNPNSLIGLSTTGSNSIPYMQVDVHWTRVIHVCDNRTSSEIIGIPRMQQVYDYLLDVRKIGGGSAEMFWQGASPGWAFETQPGIIDPLVDNESIQEQIANFRNKLRRHIALQGMTVKSLAPQVADPTNHLTQQLTLIAATLQVPLRIFLGSEAGHLASTQDADAWASRIRKRQNKYLTPHLIRVFIDRLINLGILPRPKQYFVDWEDNNIIGAKDKADIGTKLTQSLLQYVTSGAEVIMPLQEYLTKILFFDQDEAQIIVEKVSKSPELLTKAIWGMTQEGTGNVKDPTKATGTAGKRNSQG